MSIKKFIVNLTFFASTATPFFVHAMLEDIAFEDIECEDVYKANNFKTLIEEMATPPQDSLNCDPNDFAGNPIPQYLIEHYPRTILFKNHGHFQTIDARNRNTDSLIPAALDAYEATKNGWIKSLNLYYLNTGGLWLEATRSSVCRAAKEDRKRLQKRFNTDVIAETNTPAREARFFYFLKNCEILCAAFKKLKEQKKLDCSDIFINER